MKAGRGRRHGAGSRGQEAGGKGQGAGGRGQGAGGRGQGAGGRGQGAGGMGRGQEVKLVTDWAATIICTLNHSRRIEGIFSDLK